MDVKIDGCHNDLLYMTPGLISTGKRVTLCLRNKPRLKVGEEHVLNLMWLKNKDTVIFKIVTFEGNNGLNRYNIVIEILGYE